MPETNNKRRGWLFVFEGIDGSGKTTQMRRAAETLRGRGLSVVELVEPTNGPFGRRIRESTCAGGQRRSPEDELDLFIHDRMENVENNIRPALERGDVILLDRYYFSTIAYQGARGLDPATIRRRNEEFAPLPDRVLYVAIDVATALSRIERARAGETDLFERRDYLERVKAIYDDLARETDLFATIDATADEDTVARQIIEIVDGCLKHRRNP